MGSLNLHKAIVSAVFNLPVAYRRDYISAPVSMSSELRGIIFRWNWRFHPRSSINPSERRSCVFGGAERWR